MDKVQRQCAFYLSSLNQSWTQSVTRPWSPWGQEWSLVFLTIRSLAPRTVPTWSRSTINTCWMNEWLNDWAFLNYYFATSFKEIETSWTDISQVPFLEKAFKDTGCFSVAKIKGEKNRSRVTEVWAPLSVGGVLACITSPVSRKWVGSHRVLDFWPPIMETSGSKWPTEAEAARPAGALKRKRL